MPKKKSRLPKSAQKGFLDVPVLILPKPEIAKSPRTLFRTPSLSSSAYLKTIFQQGRPDSLHFAEASQMAVSSPHPTRISSDEIFLKRLEEIGSWRSRRICPAFGAGSFWKNEAALAEP